MGEYNYLLTTKSRRLKVTTGGKAEVFLIKYSDKPHFWDRTPAHISAKIGRVDAAWARLRHNQKGPLAPLATHGAFDTIETMMREIARGSFYPVYGNMNLSYFSGGYFETAEIAGQLVVKDDEIQIEMWHRMYVSLPTKTGSASINQAKWDMEKALTASGLMKSNRTVHRMSNRDGHPTDMRLDNLCLSFQNIDDMVRAKLVLADMDAKEYTPQIV